MPASISFSQVEFIMNRYCDTLSVYSKHTNTVVASFDLRITTSGTSSVIVPKYFYLTVDGSKNLNVTDVSGPSMGLLNETFTTDFLESDLHMHDMWTDDLDDPEIVVGTGDTRDIVSIYGFNLEIGVIITSLSDGKFTIYYPDGALDKREL